MLGGGSGTWTEMNPHGVWSLWRTVFHGEKDYIWFWYLLDHHRDRWTDDHANVDKEHYLGGSSLYHGLTGPWTRNWKYGFWSLLLKVRDLIEKLKRLRVWDPLLSSTHCPCSPLLVSTRGSPPSPIRSFGHSKSFLPDLLRPPPVPLETETKEVSQPTSQWQGLIACSQVITYSSYWILFSSIEIISPKLLKPWETVQFTGKQPPNKDNEVLILNELK